MSYTPTFTVNPPERAEIDAQTGPLLLEFGVDWCPHCQAAQVAIEGGLASFPLVRHLKVEDGPGRRLGRSFRVKLWPTLILLRDGVEIGRVVRPTATTEVSRLLERLRAG